MPTTAVTSSKDVLDIITQLLVIVIPIVLSWFVRNYVKNTTMETKLAAIARLSNSAIDYAENLDKRGDLGNLPTGVSKGLHKADLASSWLVTMLGTNGISMSDADAKKWVASEFQKRMGSETSKVTNIAQATKSAVDMIQNLARSNVITIPPEVDRFTYLAGLAADYVVTQLAANGMEITRDQALTWVRAELFKTVQSGDLPSGDRVADLAKQAVAFVNDLKAKGQLVGRAGASSDDVEIDLATAWMMTEAAKQGIPVTPDQILQAITVQRQRADTTNLARR